MTSPYEAPAARAVFRRALRDFAVLTVVLVVVGVGVGALVAGAPGAWGAAIGAGLAIVFSGSTIVTMLLTVASSPQRTAAVVLGGWLAKILVLVVVLAVLRDQEFYSRTALAAVLSIGVVAALAIDYRAVVTGRIPNVEPRSVQD